MRIIVRNGQFFADGFAVRGAFLLEEGERRLISYIGRNGCGYAKLRLSEDRLLVEEGRIGVIRRKGGAELFPAPLASHGGERPRKEFSCGGKTFVATCLIGEPSEILLEGDVSFRHSSKVPFFDPKISLIEGQRNAILDLRAATEEGAYLALVSLEESGARLLLEETGDSILCEGNEVTVTRFYDDLRARRATIRYLWKGTDFDCSREIVCAKEHPFIREECGRMLLEAVVAKDEKEIERLLSPEIADAKGVLDYFGEIDGARPSPFSDSPTAYSTIKRQGTELLATLYDFDFDEQGRISNIRCLDE